MNGPLGAHSSVSIQTVCTSKKGCDDVMDFSISSTCVILYRNSFPSDCFRGTKSQVQSQSHEVFRFRLQYYKFLPSLSFYSFSLISVSCASMGKEEGDFFLGRRGRQGNS